MQQLNFPRTYLFALTVEIWFFQKILQGNIHQYGYIFIVYNKYPFTLYNLCDAVKKISRYMVSVPKVPKLDISNILLA